MTAAEVRGRTWVREGRAPEAVAHKAGGQLRTRESMQRAHVKSKRAVPYRVPERFGIAAILAMMTLMSLLFGLLRWLDSPGSIFLLIGILMLAICLVQMLGSDGPRAGSIYAGMIVMPLWALGVQRLDGFNGVRLLFIIPPTLICGGVLGYLAGTVAAGVFLILDRWENPRLNEAAPWSEVDYPIPTVVADHNGPHVRPDETTETSGKLNLEPGSNGVNPL